MPFNLDDYEQVDVRLDRFYADWPLGRVVTVLLEPRAEGQYIVRAEIFRQEDGLPSASGLAEEREGSSVVNKTSALENCETSAIGRALANLGYAAKGKRPSREEMSKTSPAGGPAGTAGEPTTEPPPTGAPQAGDNQSVDYGEVSADQAPGEVGAPSSPGATNDQPGPPDYTKAPADCNHKGRSGHWLAWRRSPRGFVCPRCGLSKVTILEGTEADLGAAS